VKHTRTAICSWSYAVTSVVTARERGPYWYFQFHEGGKRKKLYLGKTRDPESILAAKRAEPSGSRLLPSLHTSLMVPTGSRGDWRMIVGTGGLLLPCTVDRKKPTSTTA
jgi:hypothetical protein